jgi:hypothetical protein
MAYVSSLFTFLGKLIMSNSSSILTVLCQFFSWIALGDVELHFSFMLVRKAIAVEQETEPCDYIINVIYPYK